jgi:hypothetical protein
LALQEGLGEKSQIWLHKMFAGCGKAGHCDTGTSSAHLHCLV